MSTLLIGDILGCQLRTWQNKNEDNKFAFIADEFAEYSWLSTVVDNQLPIKLPEADNLVIALGFNDCVYSCLWPSFNIDNIASDYTKFINNLMIDYSQTNIYICSVCPVDSQYVYNDFIISVETLNNKIKQFNNYIKNSCTATFIDCYEYLSNTSFSTRDGYHYQSNTIEKLYYLIYYSLNQDTPSSFIPRLEAPYPNSADIESDMYWVSSSYNGGLNPFPLPSASMQKSPGDTLPNCTAYAWGRFYELMNERPKLYTGNAETWYSKGTDYDGYERGDIPKLGAIICWEGIGSEAGHVAIVEQINADGSIVTSESGWNTSAYWWTTTRKNDGNWSANTSKYVFQGFIYCPKVISISGISTNSSVNKSDVTISNESITGATQENNAIYIWQYLGSEHGDRAPWTLNAVAALLGNIQAESAINPGRYEAYTYDKNSSMWLGPNPSQSEINTWLENYKVKKGRYPGFGLTQWTSKGINSWSEHKLISWCNARGLDPTDIDSQLQRIEWEAETNTQWYGYKQDIKDYPIPFKEFPQSNKEPEWLAKAFLLRYEIPGNRYDYLKVRSDNARHWYDFLSAFAPGFSKIFNIFNFKIDLVTDTSIKVSFIVSQGKSYSCKLLKNGKQEAKKESSIIESDELQIISLTFSSLTPNTEYLIDLTVNGINESDNKNLNISCYTEQSYPSNIDSIMLSDNLEDGYIFNLTFDEITEWGYWKKFGYGYDIALIVNGKLVDTKEKTSAYNGNINLIKYFKKYKPLLTDNIQIGVCPWTLYNNKKLYAQEGYKTSKSICLLKQNIVAYLN